jgi:hypothetical protein
LSNIVLDYTILRKTDKGEACVPQQHVTRDTVTSRSVNQAQRRVRFSQGLVLADRVDALIETGIVRVDGIAAG